MSNNAILVLEDGRVFKGKSFGAVGERTGEIVFNTSMTGYQEVLTDPSYAGQIVVMTYPHMGNYGVNPGDGESRRPCVEGFVVREFSPEPSHYLSESGLDDYLREHGIVGISEVDTRAVVRHIRDRGAMRACLSTVFVDESAALGKALSSPSMIGRELVGAVSCRQAYEWAADQPRETAYHVVAYDLGAKYSILRHLVRVGCRVTVVPAATSAQDVLALRPDGVFLSNGPGDPEPLTRVTSAVRHLIGRSPVFGICLGHQVLGLALGGRTYKLKFGHRGGNHPVKNLMTGRVEITTQNHGFAVDAESLPSSDIELTHINLNDGTLEGFRHRSLPLLSVQYHPEASPGPHDSLYLFDEFARMMSAVR